MENLNNMETLLSIRTKINNNFTELDKKVVETNDAFNKKLLASKDAYLKESGNYGRLFTDTSDFVYWYGLIEHTTENVQTGTTSLKISVDTGENGTSAAQLRNLNWNLSKAKNLLIRFFVPTLTGLSKFQLRFLTSDSTAYLYHEVTTWSDMMHQGWNEILISPENLISVGGATTDILANVLHIQLSVTGSAEVSITFDSMWIDHMEPANIIFQFDDARTSVYTTAFPIMKRYGFVGNIGVISSVVGSSSYMSEAQLAAVYTYAWDLFNHTKSHQALTGFDAEAMREELNTCREWLNERGYSRASNFVAYPHGEYDSNVLAVMQAEGYFSGRTIMKGMEVSPPIRPYELKVLNMQNTTENSVYQEMIDKLVLTGGTLIILFHRIEDSGTDSTVYLTANFRTLVDYIYNTKCNVISISEWIYRMNLQEGLNANVNNEF